MSRIKIAESLRLFRVFLLIPLLLILMNYSSTRGGVRTLPDGTPLAGRISKTAYDSKNLIVLFGKARLSSTEDAFIELAEAILDGYALEEDVELLFYAVDEDAASLEAYARNRQWTHVSYFTISERDMWRYLVHAGFRASSLASSPVVVYLNRTAEPVVTEGFRDKASVTAAVRDMAGGFADPHRVLTAKPLENNLSADELSILWDGLPRSEEDIFAEAPCICEPYTEGRLSLAYIENCAKVLNFARRLSGLPYVTASEKLSAFAQQGALLMALSGYGHNPPAPADMSAELYMSALEAARSSNIAYSYANEPYSPRSFTETLLYGWLADSDAENLSHLGHRRSILNPTLSSWGLGSVFRQENGVSYRYDALYAPGSSEKAPAAYQAVAYPAGSLFPSELLRGGVPWSVSLNPNLYAPPREEELCVTMTGGGKTHILTHGMQEDGDAFLSASREPHGTGDCIIFRPDGIEAYDDVYTVRITGLRTWLGEQAELSYTVRFVNMEKSVVRS